MRKSRDYLMKCLGFVLLLGFISLGAIGGCNNNGGGQDGTALTENDFSEDPSISAKADGGVVVSFLEPPGGEKPERDTGEVGTDIVPYRYNQTFEHTFCWEDENQAAEHFMTLIDAEGVEVLKVEVNGDCKTEVIEKGNYEMHVHHDGLSEDTLPIFIQPMPEDQLGKNSASEQGIIKIVKRLLEDTFRYIGFSTDAKAQSVAQNVSTLLSSKKCITCDLIEANLVAVTLTNAVLAESDLKGADLTVAGLAGADLSITDLNGADMLSANLTNVNLLDAVLIDAVLIDATLTGANLMGVTLSSTTFTNATWCDGSCICGENSVDICVGCASIDTCTGN